MAGIEPSGVTRMPLSRLALCWLALSALLLLAGLGTIAQRQFPDPDDALRLIQVRDLLAGQGWFDLHQYRIDPPQGTPMHWSRLVDIPVAAVILLLQPLLGMAGAEMAALVVVPLLTFGAILLVVGRLAGRLLGAEIATLSCLACGLMPVLVQQLRPLRIDHHGWQVFTVALAMSSLATTSARRSGWLAGLALAAGLNISVELLPLAAGFAAILFLNWMQDPQRRWRLAHFMVALASGLAAFFMLTRGTHDLAPWCDAIAPAHLAFFAVAAAGTWIIASLPVLPRLATVGLFAVAGGLAAAAFLALAPQCLASPFANLDPLVRAYWYVNVKEGMPYWEQNLPGATPTLLQALLGLGTAAWLWGRAPQETRGFWQDCSLLALVALLAGFLVWRSMAFAALLTSIPLGWLAHRMFAWLRQAQGPGNKAALFLATALVLFPALPVIAVEALVVDRSSKARREVVVLKSSCELNTYARNLDRFPAGTLFAPLDIGPALLEQTHHGVVATGHHRANAAMADVIRAFTSDPAAAERIVRAHGAAFVVVCFDLMEPRLFARGNPQGLSALLQAGQVPGWLERVEAGTPDSLRIYRVK